MHRITKNNFNIEVPKTSSGTIQQCQSSSKTLIRSNLNNDKAETDE